MTPDELPEHARAHVDALGLAPSEVAACLRTASTGRRPPLRSVDDFEPADLAHFYYFTRLATAVAAEKGAPMPTPESVAGELTNRPTYAPERRPGDPQDDLEGRELVVFVTTIRDAGTIAALIESGAAALKYAPASATALVELNSRRADYRLGSKAAKALRAEAARIHDANEHRHREKAKADKRAAKAAASK